MEPATQRLLLVCQYNVLVRELANRQISFDILTRDELATWPESGILKVVKAMRDLLRTSKAT